MRELTVPQLGEGLTEVRVLRLLKLVGEHVERDEVLYEVETAKSTMEIESPCAGRVQAWLVEEGADVPVGAPLVRIATEPEAGTDGPLVRVPPRTRVHAQNAGLTEEQIEQLALAKGAVLLPEHIDEWSANGRPSVLSATSGDPFVRVPVDDEISAFDEDVPPAQRLLHRSLAEARNMVVPALVSTRLDAAVLSRAAEVLRCGLTSAVFTTDFTAFVHLAARATDRHPALRTSRMGLSRRRVFDRLHAAVAVSGQDGLTTAAIHEADTPDFAEFARAYSTAVERALESGGGGADTTVTLTLSHLDSPSAQFAVPVVVPPASATLFLGAADREGQRHIVLSFDHLVMDGEHAARYLDDLVNLIATTAQGAGAELAAPLSKGGASVSGDVTQQVASAVRDLLGTEPDPDLPLGQYGMTSLQAVTLAQTLNRVYGLDLPVTALWHHPTVRALADAVTDGVSSAMAAVAPSTAVRPTSAPLPRPLPVHEPVALIGAACRLPGADNVEEYWNLLCGGRDAFRDVPVERLPGFSPASLGTDPPNVRAGLLDRIDTFDAPFFRMSPRIAGATDPQQRLLLELSWHALENAALSPDALAGTRTAVFVGAGGYDYRELVAQHGIADGSTATGTLQAYLANRISQFYGFHGPSITVDTACSGALTAFTLAVDALRSGSCDIAVVGSASLISNGFNAAAYYRAGMLSPSGSGTAFDDGCNGYVRGEGGVVCVLKRLADAERDQDPVIATVLGTAVNHGGWAASSTAPNPAAQSALIQMALKDAGVPGEALGYLEAHGTATPLGDPIEWQSLAAALDGVTRAAGPRGRLWISSAKSYVGHLEGAAGLVGLLTAALVVQRGRIPALAGFSTPNHRLGSTGVPLALAEEGLEWPTALDRPRIAAVNSFGLGGSNAHVILQASHPGFPPGASASRTAAANRNPDGVAGLLAFPLSARTDTALRLLADSLATSLTGTPDQYPLEAVAATLQLGRAALPVRSLILARDLTGLTDALTALAHDRTDTGIVSPGTPFPAEMEKAAVLVAEEWLRGEAPDWRPLWQGRALPRRMPLPPYPFQRRRYWLSRQGTQRPRAVPLPPEANKPSSGATT